MGRHTITAVERGDGADEWIISVANAHWKATDKILDWGIDGIDVDLDTSDETSEHYTIISNSTDTITLVTTDDLSGVIGQELVGVHWFSGISVLGGSSATFGDDNVLLHPN